MIQIGLPVQVDPEFPGTRYQGSKLKVVDWICENLKDLEFETVLDAFGGTGAVGYALKKQKKQVFYNDLLRFNYLIGVALIENSQVRLSDDDVDWLLQNHVDVEYPKFIQNTFKDIYYTDEENQWLDVVVANIENLEDRYKRALAFFALFQACIAKRPFNLFHRKNLYIRTSEVPRRFGNKATWDRPFPDHFRNFAHQANKAVFDNGQQNEALNCDALEIRGQFDLVYIDTPYISSSGVGVDYSGFYHFLQGLSQYETWPMRIDHRSAHKRLVTEKKNEWTDQKRIYAAFDKLFEKFQDSILAVSYRSSGIPSEEELLSLLKQYKKSVRLYRRDYQYVLSPRSGEELLFIAN